MSLSVSPRYVTTADAVERLFAVLHPDKAAVALEEEAERQDLHEHFHKNFPGVDDPSIQFKWEDIALLWHVAEDEQEDLRSKSMIETTLRVKRISARDAESAAAKWESARNADMGAAKQRHDETVSARRWGTFSEVGLMRLYELRHRRRVRDGLRDGAAIELCSALAKGHLAAFLSGESSPIDRARWDNGDALCVLKGGLQADGRVVVLKTADFEAWLHSGRDATGAPAPDVAEASGREPGTSAPMPRPPVPLPLKRSGPPPDVRDAAAARMVEDFRAKKQTPDTLLGMKQDSLASQYGVKSRTTARAALSQAIETFRVCQSLSELNPDK